MIRLDYIKMGVPLIVAHDVAFVVDNLMLTRTVVVVGVVMEVE